TPALPLAEGEHTIGLSLGPESITWKFTVHAGAQAVATPAQNNTDAETPPPPAAQPASPEAVAAATQTGARTQTQHGATPQSPSLYQNSQFVTSATPRPGVETNWKTPAGAFGLYTNLNDLPLGGGPGFTFHQRLLGADWDVPLPKKYAELRLMWLSVKENGLPADPPGSLVAPGGGDLYGGRLLLHLSPQWLWTSEYAWGCDTQNPLLSPHHLFGRAWQ